MNIFSVFLTICYILSPFNEWNQPRVVFFSKIGFSCKLVYGVVWRFSSKRDVMLGAKDEWISLDFWQIVLLQWLHGFEIGFSLLYEHQFVSNGCDQGGQHWRNPIYPMCWVVATPECRRKCSDWVHWASRVWTLWNG